MSESNFFSRVRVFFNRPEILSKKELDQLIHVCVNQEHIVVDETKFSRTRAGAANKRDRAISRICNSTFKQGNSEFSSKGYALHWFVSYVKIDTIGIAQPLFEKIILQEETHGKGKFDINQVGYKVTFSNHGSLFSELCRKNIDVSRMARILINNGSNAKEVGFIHLVVQKYDNPNILNILLEAGVDINEKDSAGMTALHHAAQRNHVGYVNVLCDNLLTPKSHPPFVNPLIKDRDGNTPLDLARTSEVRDVLIRAENIKTKTIISRDVPLIPDLKRLLVKQHLVKPTEVSQLQNFQRQVE